MLPMLPISTAFLVWPGEKRTKQHVMGSLQDEHGLTYGLTRSNNASNLPQSNLRFLRRLRVR